MKNLSEFCLFIIHISVIFCYYSHATYSYDYLQPIIFVIIEFFVTSVIMCIPATLMSSTMQHLFCNQKLMHLLMAEAKICLPECVTFYN